LLVESYLVLIDQAYNRQSWHGTNLRGSLRGVTPKEAAWRLAPGRHNIWEEIVHAAYWKYVVRRRLTGERRASFALEGSNWFARPDRPDPAAWKKDIALLDESHRALREVIANLSEASLKPARGGKRNKIAWHVSGIAAHDLYHAGQIQLLKSLQR
jgi:DinB superfamily